MTIAIQPAHDRPAGGSEASRIPLRATSRFAVEVGRPIRPAARLGDLGGVHLSQID